MDCNDEEVKIILYHAGQYEQELFILIEITDIADLAELSFITHGNSSFAHKAPKI